MLSFWRDLNSMVAFRCSKMGILFRRSFVPRCRRLRVAVPAVYAAMHVAVAVVDLPPPLPARLVGRF